MRYLEQHDHGRNKGDQSSIGRPCCRVMAVLRLLQLNQAVAYGLRNLST